MEFTCDYYAFPIPEDAVPDVLTYIADDAIRTRILDAIDHREGALPVRLSVTHCDLLLEAYSAWERDQ